MSGKIKANPRYEVVSFRTTKERRARIDAARGQSSVSEFLDTLTTLYLQEYGNARTRMGHEICTT